MGQPYVGEIRMVGFNFAPVNWALCNGQLMSISDNPALFQLIGTTYGGDGQTTFALPNLQGRIALHQGTSSAGISYVMGEFIGSESVTLTTQTMPSHTHPVPCAAAGNSSSPANAVYGGDTAQAAYGPPDGSTNLNNAALSVTGQSLPHNNQMPYLVINFIIALFGVFPSQG